LIFIPAKPIVTQKEQANTESPDSKSTSASLSNGRSNDSPEDPKSITISTPSTEQSIVESHFTYIERERLRLMNHYTLHTSKSITEITIPEDRDQSIWRNWVTELAFENDFLLHGLLSLSALHLALCGVSRQKHIVMAIHHHDLGVALFRPHLSNIAADNYDAVFGFSCVVAFYSFGIQRSSESKVNPIAKIHQVLTLIRGSAVIVKSDHEALKRSRWSVLMLPGPFQSTQKLPDEMEDMLSKLLQRTSTTNSAATQEDVYTSAIQTLRDNLTIAITYQHAQITVTFFPNMSPTDFWAMVCIGEPLALAILANYAVILYWLRKNIWMEGWGKETVDAVRQALPPEWHECIAWAIRETECA
jgi:Fungal specific transcription factor domain